MNYLNDVTNAAFYSQVFPANQGVSGATTSSAIDCVMSQGRMTLFVDLAGTITGNTTIQVQECATSSGSYVANTNGVITTSTTGLFAVTFERTQRYLEVVVTPNGSDTPKVCSIILSNLVKFN
jgi:hypothetical protein